MKSLIKSLMIFPTLATATVAITAYAADAPKIDTGDTAFTFISAALVMLMLPGLFMLYAGMVRRKNVLNIIMQSFIVLAMVSVQWVLFGYSISFGHDTGGIIGSLQWLGLHGVGLVPDGTYSSTVPHQLFVLFQLMFAIITVALISGSVAERMRFPAFLVFALVWTTFIYDPLAHWVWGTGGWLKQLGVLDFSGGTVVEICSGVSGLVMCLVLGKRKGYGVTPMPPHNLPFTILGAGILWFGWFGFNAGSALSANGIAVNAFMATNTAGAAATMAWVFTEWLHRKKPTVLGAASGSLAGLVAITPACGYVDPMGALIIGIVAGVFCYWGVSILKQKFGYDDSLDVFGIHGIGGTWGTIATGLFATTSVNPTAANGLFYGNPNQLGIQLVGMVATYAFVGIGTFAALKLVGAFMKLRATDEEEEMGLDITQHGEQAYDGEVGSLSMAAVSLPPVKGEAWAMNIVTE